MKPPPIQLLALLLGASTLTADEATKAKSVLPEDVLALATEEDPLALANALLINNRAGRAIDPTTGRLKAAPELGRAVDAGEVMVIAWSIVSDDVVDLYSSIKRLPESADAVRIWYTDSDDFKEGTLLGYTIERPQGTEIRFVRYDKRMPWLQWIRQSFAEVDAAEMRKAEEGAGEPVTRSESDAEGCDKPQID
ncbi:MAG: hypothetical protein AAGI48_13365 [Verrucomicrobiota bacterium]